MKSTTTEQYTNELQHAALKLVRLLADQHYDPADQLAITNDRLLKMMGEPFGLEWNGNDWIAK